MDSILGRVIAALLILLAVAGVVFLEAQAQDRQRVQTFVAELTTLRDNAAILCGHDVTGCSALTSQTLIAAGIVPAGMAQGASSLVDPWGHSLVLQTGTYLGGALFNGANGYALQVSNLSTSNCVALLTALRAETAVASATATTPLPAAQAQTPAGAQAVCASAQNTVLVGFALP